MANPEQTVRWSALAPLGRLGRALGFRWIFFFTFPIPFHPLLYRAIPVAVIAWLVWLAIGGGDVDWSSPLILAGILAIPLSVPFLQWILFAFRIHFVQAAMLPAALVLLLVAAAKGEQPLWLATLRIALFAIHAAAAWHGRRKIKAWQADNASVDSLPDRTGPLPPLLVRGKPGIGYTASALLERLALPAIHYEDDHGCHFLLRTDDSAAIERLTELKRSGLGITQLDKRQERRTISVPAEPPAGAVILEPAPKPEGSAFLRGGVAGVQAIAPGAPPLVYWYGRPSPLSWFPGFYFFMHLRLGSTASYSPAFGLTPAQPRALGKHGEEQSAYAALANAHRLDGPPPPTFADPEEVRGQIQAVLDARLGPDLEALDRLIAAPQLWMRRDLKELIKLPRLYADRAPELVAALRVARDAHHVDSAILLATLISKLPEDAYQGIGDELLELLDSKSLAGRLVWDDPVDENGRPKFEGFRLLALVPALYARLGELGERARPLVTGLSEVFPHIEAIQQAMAKLDEAKEQPR